MSLLQVSKIYDDDEDDNDDDLHDTEWLGSNADGADTSIIIIM